MAGPRVVFMGTPEFAVPTLAALCSAAGMDVIAVYTQPPRRAGRGGNIRRTAVHAAALAHEIPVHAPADLKSAEVQAEFAALGADAAVVVAYGLILPPAILRAPRLGCLNLHASLLPRWRGAAPIQRAVMAGDRVTGVSVMVIDEGLDTGAELLRAEQAIGPQDTAGELHDRLAEIGAPLMLEALRGVSGGQLVARPQPETGVTHAKKITKAEARIDWRRGAAELDCHIRGLAPFPGAWCEWRGERIKILLAEVAPASGEEIPGIVVDDGLLVACGAGSLRLLMLQRPGKGVMPAAEFLRGTAILPGARLS
ncbi:MAG: methionyl-tRNA formyltransferase [Alphaproteobacteria bacterium]